MSFEYQKKNIVLARNLRKHATKEEKQLWYHFLSGYPVRFQRQKAIGRYIVDFYCHKAKLIVELDGSQHFAGEQLLDDGQRDYWLGENGFTVLRIPNDVIRNNFHGACEMIDRAVKTSMGLPVED